MIPGYDKLAQLDPSGRAAAQQFVAYLRSVGLPVAVTSGRRTARQQAELTPAAGLYKAVNSRHVEGRAFDLALIGYRWQEVPPAYWRFMGTIWEQLGGRWGGNFSRPDPIHFDW